MTAAHRRLLAVCLGAAGAVAAGGLGWELIRFGTSLDATAARLERQVRSRFAYQARRVEALARIVADEQALVRDAESRPEALPALFSRLAQLGNPVGLAGASATVYAARSSGAFRVLAWSDGPAEDLTPDRLAGPATIFVAPGASGLRLVAVHPIELDGARLGMAAAELVLSERTEQPPRASGACAGRLPTSYGPVDAIAPCGGAGVGLPAADGFVIAGDAGTTLLEVRYQPGQLRAQRARFRRGLLVAVSIPLVVLGLLLTAPLLARRNRSRGTTEWLGWTLVIAAILFTLVFAARGLGTLAGVDAVAPAVTGLAALALASLIAGGWWWRPLRRRPVGTSVIWFLVEHLAGGLLLAGTLWLLSGVLRGRIAAASIGVWQFPLFPFDTGVVLYLIGVLLTQIALWWAMASVLGVLADRWRLDRWRPRVVLATVACWMAPAAALAAIDAGQAATWPWLGVAGALTAFGILSGAIRRAYRHTTHAMRLGLLFGALAGPPLVTYPLTAAAADDAARTLIEAEFAPAVLDQPQAVLTSLARAQQEIDALPQLGLLIATAPRGDGSSAYAVWSRTSLAAARLTSEVELFGADLRLVSRFALNVPEYPYGADVPRWTGTGCTWEVFGEVARTGAQERVMLHAERAVCDPQGAILGAIVVHAVSDYRALPFIASGSPYWEALRTDDQAAAGVRLAGLELAVYGWNDSPLFTSGGIAWPIRPDISERLYRSRDPFWTALEAGGTPYAVYFVNDRRGFYALGYPYPAFMEHATRLAELTAVVGALLVLLLIGATAYAPLLSTSGAPLPALIHEIRTSFYRKLFLFFVLSAVGPIILLALAFGAYTSARIRADVESEAANAVTITRRLFEEFTAFEQHPDEEQAPVSDELMVLIRQMTNQDANLYIGSRLVASSQRDLFDSGLLPTRTPANVYREIAIHRLPTFVGEDRIGAFTYLVAAAPIPARGRDAIISVALGTRQREIEHEIEELNRRVLVGAVVVVLFAAGLGASVAGRVSDPVARLTRAARQIAAGRLDVRIVADTADELRRLVDDFNVMTATLAGQRVELARSNQLKAWAQMARQVAHEIKNPLTPIQLAAEHLQRVHEDRGRALGPVVDQCVATILGQVRLLRQIAADFSNFAAEPTPRFETVPVGDLVMQVVQPYRPGATGRIRLEVDVPGDLPPLRIDRTLVARALTNLIENALQAMPQGGRITVSARRAGGDVALAVADTGVGMDAEAASRAFEPYFSTKTGGSGLGLPNAKRYVELSGGSTSLATAPGEGTTITLMLPAASPDGNAGAPAATR